MRSKLNKFLDGCPKWVQDEVWGENGMRAEIDQLQQRNAELERERDELNNRLSRCSMCAGRADQYRAESRKVRELLGFNPDCEHVSPNCLEKAFLRHDAEVASKAIEDFVSYYMESYWIAHLDKKAGPAHCVLIAANEYANKIRNGKDGE